MNQLICMVVSSLRSSISVYHIWRGLSPPIASAYPAQKNPAVWSCILAGALALLSVALIIETALKKEPGEEKKAIDWKSPGMIHVYIMLGIVVSFVVLMKIVGMLLALLIMIPAIEYLMGCRSKVMLIALAFFGISIITSVSGKSVIKGLMGGILGLLFATVGVDNFTGTYRFTFGSSFLKGGLAMIPILIGVFAFAQVLKTIEEKYNEQPLHERVKIERVFPRKDDLKTIAPTVVRSSILGTFIGAVPGTGGDIASWVGYNMAKRFSKYPEKFGHGSPEGIAGSEAANNAIAGGAFVPLLALGIPGDAGTAVMMGALTMQGIVFGPSLFTEEPGKAYIVFIALFVANILMGICGFSMIRVFGKVIDVPNKYLVPVIMTFCITGTFALNHYLEEVFLMLIMGVIGFVLIKLDFAMPPIILGLVLGSLAEKNARRSIDLLGSSETIWQHPIAIIFIVLAIASLVSPAISAAIKKRKAAKAAATEEN